MDHIQRQIAETDAALEHAQRQRDGLALLALTDPRQEKPLAEAEALVQRHQLQRQRLEAAQRGAAAAAVIEGEEVLQARLAAAITVLQGTDVVGAAKQVERAVDALQAAVNVFMLARAPRPEALQAAAGALGQLVPEARASLRTAPAGLTHFAVANDIAAPLLTRLATVLDNLQPLIGRGVELPQFTASTVGIAEAAERAHETLVDRLAGWNVATVSAAVSQPVVAYHDRPAAKTKVIDGVSVVLGTEVAA